MSKLWWCYIENNDKICGLRSEVLAFDLFSCVIFLLYNVGVIWVYSKGKIFCAAWGEILNLHKMGTYQMCPVCVAID